MQAIHKAGRVLAEFTAQQPEWGVRALAAHLDWPRSSVHVYLDSLHQAGFLRRLPGGRYRLSWRLAEYGALLTAALPWFPVARAALADLARTTHSLGFLCVLEEGRVVCINRALGDPTEQAHRIEADVTLPANATAAGKVLYAHAGLPDPPFERYTASTIVTPDEWAGELQRVRQSGHARAIEEWAAQQCALAVPLWWQGEMVAALGLQLPTSRFLVRERPLLAQLRRAAGPFERREDG